MKHKINISKINLKYIENKLLKYNVVSFDIFDTLIKRDCYKNTDIFFMMEMNNINKYPEYSGFAKNRIIAERIARRDTEKEEITLDDIYYKMEQLYPKEICSKFKKMEIDYEYSICNLNSSIYRIYKKCIEAGKQVILVSDMYIEKNIIKNILNKLKITGYNKLYLSSEIGLTKLKGTLYNFILSDLNISSDEMVHIGDDIRSDYLRPRMNRIHAIHIPVHMNYNNIFYNDCKIIPKEYIYEYRQLTSFIYNHNLYENMHKEYFTKIGFETLGPLLYGFIKWLYRQANDEGIKRIFFLARDGQLIEKAYKLMYKEKNLECTYMYASRSSLIVPTLWMCKSFKEIQQSMFIPRIGTIEEFLNQIGLNSSEYKGIIEEYGYDLKKVYLYQDLFKETSFCGFFEQIKQDVYNNSKKQYDALVTYLNKISFKNKVAIVDIGWHGNMQKALNKICECAKIEINIYGYYIALNPNIDIEQKNLKMKGYLFQKGKNEELFEYEKTFTSIFEMFFSANHGTVKSFYLTDKNVPCIKFGKHEFKDDIYTYSAISKVQEGALGFIKSILAEKEFYIEASPYPMFQNLMLLGNAPSYSMACRFGNLCRNEGFYKEIAKPKNLAIYILRPDRLFKDLKLFPWRIGFLRRLFKLNLPYVEIYMMLRRIYLKIKKG